MHASYQDIQKAKKQWICALWIYQSISFPTLVEDFEDVDKTPQTSTIYEEELGDCFHIT